jgi:hypothetical protein
MRGEKALVEQVKAAARRTQTTERPIIEWLTLSAISLRVFRTIRRAKFVALI